MVVVLLDSGSFLVVELARGCKVLLMARILVLEHWEKFSFRTATVLIRDAWVDLGSLFLILIAGECNCMFLLARLFVGTVESRDGIVIWLDPGLLLVILPGLELARRCNYNIGVLQGKARPTWALEG